MRTSRTARGLTALTAFLGLLEVVTIIAQAILLASVISDAFLGGADLADVSGRLVALAGLAVVRGILAGGYEAMGRMGAARVMAELRERLVEHLLHRRPGGLAGERSGEIAAAAVQGVDALEAYFAKYLPQVALAAIAPFLILAVIVPRDLDAALILAVTFPLIPIFMILIGKLAESRTRKRWQVLSRLSAHFLDVVSGLATLRAHGRADAQGDTIAEAGDRYRAETMRTLRVGFLSALVLELLAMLGTALVAATVGVQLVNGDLGFTAGLTVLLLAPELYLPLRAVGAQFHASADGMAAAERIFEVLDTPATVSVPEHPRRCPDPGASGVVVRELSFSHPERPDSVLENVSFDLAPGQATALVGPSGAGKTTLASLLLRLADPSAGGILCDGTDIREVDPREWRRQIAWVPQRPTIFAGTVAENVRFARPDATDEVVWSALGEADAAAFIAELPDGLETVVGEGGRGLSAGQAQRLALARAFVADAPFVILDEPTAHLDRHSERSVAAAVERLTEGRTALVIAHRAEPIARVDRTLELRDGVITEVPGIGARGE